jgi:hypothetical protein
LSPRSPPSRSSRDRWRPSRCRQSSSSPSAVVPGRGGAGRRHPGIRQHHLRARARVATRGVDPGRSTPARRRRGRDRRQVGIVDSQGGRSHTGKECQPWAGQRTRLCRPGQHPRRRGGRQAMGARSSSLLPGRWAGDSLPPSRPGELPGRFPQHAVGGAPSSSGREPVRQLQRPIPGLRWMTMSGRSPSCDGSTALAVNALILEGYRLVDAGRFDGPSRAERAIAPVPRCQGYPHCLLPRARRAWRCCWPGPRPGMQRRRRAR